MKFKVGDKVKVVANEERLGELAIPEEHKLTGIEGTVWDVETKSIGVDFGSDYNGVWSFKKQDLKLIEEPTEAGHIARTFIGHPEGALEVKEDKTHYGHPRFYEMLEAMADLHSRKNHDYAGTSDPLKNLRACERLELTPFLGVMVRLQDKWSRLEEFVKSGKLMVKGESVKDTLMDNAVYSILAIILYEEHMKEDKDYDAAMDHYEKENVPDLRPHRRIL